MYLLARYNSQLHIALFNDVSIFIAILMEFKRSAHLGQTCIKNRHLKFKSLFVIIIFFQVIICNIGFQISIIFGRFGSDRPAFACESWESIVV